MADEKIHFLEESELKSSRAYYELTVPHIITTAFIIIAAIFIFFVCYVCFAPYDVVIKVGAVLRPDADISEVKSIVTGVLVRKNFLPGQRVSKGTLLYSIDNESLILQKEAALAKYEDIKEHLAADAAVIKSLSGDGELKIYTVSGTYSADFVINEKKRLMLEYEKARKAFENEKEMPDSVVTPKQISDLEDAVKIAELQLDEYVERQKKYFNEEEKSYLLQVADVQGTIAQLDDKIKNTSICSPIDGWIEDTTVVNTGEVIFSGEMLGRIIPDADNKIKAVLTVPSEDIAEISQGMTFLLSFPKLPPSEYGYLEGTIETIPRDAEMDSGSNPVYKVNGCLKSCTLKKCTTEIRLMPGMEAEGRIIIKRERIIRYLLEKLDFVS